MSSESRNLPTFLIIGCGKCGTSSLFRYLAAHPQVCPSTFKEVNFFNRDENWNRGLDWYAHFFRKDTGSIARGEASTDYTKATVWPGVPERIHSVLPDVKLVYVIRHPIDRIRSAYQYRQTRLDNETEPLSKLLLSDPRRTKWIEQTLYAFQIEQYLRFFPREQILVISSERLRKDRVATVKEVCRFIGVDPDADIPTLGREYNAVANADVPPSIVVAARRPLAKTSVYKRVPKQVRADIRRRLSRPHDDSLATITPEAEAFLWSQFDPDLARLRTMVGPEFDLWGRA